jgi:sulfur carrier protein ThiS
MNIHCTFLLVPDGKTLEYHGILGDTYEKALLAFGINPDTVLIIFHKQSIPQDKIIEEDVVEIISTCSGG